MGTQEIENITNRMQDELFTMEQSNEQSTKRIEPEFSVSKTGLTLMERTKQEYHTQRLQQSRWAFYFSIASCIVGFGVIIFGVGWSVFTKNVEWIIFISGTIVDAIAALFLYLNNKANDKISEFFRELMFDSSKKDAQNLVQKIENREIRDELIVKLALHLSGVDDKKIFKNIKEICKKDNETM